MFNNLIGGGNTQSFKNYAQQATDIVTKNNSKITPQPLQNSLQVPPPLPPQQVPPPLPPQQVPPPLPPQQVPPPLPPQQVPNPLPPQRLQEQVPTPLPKQVVEPEQMIEQVQVSAQPVLEKNNNTKNNTDQDNNNNEQNNNLNINLSNEQLNSLPKSKRNLVAKLEMLKSVNEEIPIKVINALIYILSYEQKQSIFKNMREFIKNNDNIV